MTAVPPPALALADLLRSPDQLLFAFEPGRAVFLPMDPAAYARSIFCDGRIQPLTRQARAAPLPALASATAGLAPTPAAWILHVAHCGSTLLARGLEGPDPGGPGAPLVIREPLALRQAAVARATGDPAGADQLRLAALTLGRRYAPATPTVIKANVPVNFAAEALLADQPDAPVICLYFPLEAYLAAVLRSDNHRGWVTAVTTELAAPLTAEAGPLPAPDPVARAAWLWLGQMRVYARLLEAGGPRRSLDADTLFADPAGTLAAAAALFGLPLGPDDIAAVVAGPLFRSYAKNPAAAFDETRRQARRAEARAALGDAPDRAREIVRRLVAASGRPLPERLPAPLAGTAPPLLA
jgi:hypothetical protein